MKHFGSTSGLTVLAEDQATPANGMVAYVTSSYNSGYQNGDIKLAALADTTAGTLSGTPLLDDDFSTYADTAAMKAAGWSSATSTGTGDISLATGAMQLDADGLSNRARGAFAISTSVGRTYVVEYSASSPLTYNHHFRVGTAENGAQNFEILNEEAGAHAKTFTATSGTTYVTWEGFNAAGNETQIDNISVRLADPDRSVNGKGLAVHGSITKAAVATGADVVAYSGFNSSNYLEQPYNSDLDFGTGDFCVMGWVRPTANFASNVILHRSLAGSAGGVLIKSSATGAIEVYLTNTTSFSLVLTSSATMATGVYTSIVVLRRSGTVECWVNGVLAGTTSNTNNISYTNAVLRVGLRNDSSLETTHSLALIRISGTAPTADQIKKIYEDEKVLFQEGAKATLYGSSDAVTALAHDPVTDLLHVGTSSGRSVFQGLRRVDNTTTAVSTAISANDSLIVEQ